MKRIEYENVKDCEREYLRTLGFLDENEEFTNLYNWLNNNWKIIRENKDFPFLILFPKEINYFLFFVLKSMLIILVDFFK